MWMSKRARSESCMATGFLLETYCMIQGKDLDCIFIEKKMKEEKKSTINKIVYAVDFFF